MRIPILKKFLTKLLTVDLPGAMMLPRRLNFNINPSFTAIAEAAIGQEAVRGAVLAAIAAVQQRDGSSFDEMHEESIASAAAAAATAALAASPNAFTFPKQLGPSIAGGVSLPEAFQAELIVNLVGARGLPTYDVGLSDPYACLSLGSQHETSKRNSDTGGGAELPENSPMWNQEFQFLVRDPTDEFLSIDCLDTRFGNVPVAYGGVRLPLGELEEGRTTVVWLPLEPSENGAAVWAPPRNDMTVNARTTAPMPSPYARIGSAVAGVPTGVAGRGSSGEVLVELTLKSFVDDDMLDSGYIEYARTKLTEMEEEQLLLSVDEDDDDKDEASSSTLNGMYRNGTDVSAHDARLSSSSSEELAAAEAVEREETTAETKGTTAVTALTTSKNAAAASAAATATTTTTAAAKGQTTSGVDIPRRFDSLSSMGSFDELDDVEVTGAVSAAQATTAAAARATRSALRAATRVFRRQSSEELEAAEAAEREEKRKRNAERKNEALSKQQKQGDELLSAQEIALRASTALLCAGMAVAFMFLVTRFVGGGGGGDIPPPPLP